LKRALRINPHDIDGLKDTILRAIAMPKSERARRMRALRKRVKANDVAAWSHNFIAALALARGTRHDRVSPLAMSEELEWTIDRAERG